MLFNSGTFAAFFVTFVAAYFLIARSRRQKLVVIVVGSLVFYGSWSFEFIPVLLGTGLLDFYLARAMSRIDDKAKRKALLTISVVSNLGALAFFKYTNFAIDTFDSLLESLGLAGHPAIPFLEIGVPLGISFYTFQSISYTVDVYRRVFKPTETLLEFLASLTFFPHLLSGPIVRSSALIPQFVKLAPPRWENVYRALPILAAGLIKKGIADRLGAVVDGVFESDVAPGFWQSWGGAVAFAGQMFGDFSGYSDMAIGLALLLGFELPENFNLPYIATSPVEFWKRFHISLSTWIRDYPFYSFALGLFRRRPRLNLFVVMVLMGVWHGPGWKFLAFGAYHGTLVVATHWLTSKFRRVAAAQGLLARIPKIAFTFYLIVLGEVMFRAPDLSAFGRMMTALHTPDSVGVDSGVVVTLGVVVGAVVLMHGIDYLVRRRTFVERPVVAWSAAAVAMCAALMLTGTGRSFIYFQF